MRLNRTGDSDIFVCLPISNGKKAVSLSNMKCSDYCKSFVNIGLRKVSYF